MSLTFAANLAYMLECGVCSREFEACGSMKPKMLPCQHSFCTECLGRIAVAGRIECPICRKIWQKTVNELTNNLLLMQLIDSREQSSRKPELPAAPCESPTEQDLISALRKWYKEPTKAFLHLEALQHAQRTVRLEHISVIFQCLEYYAQTPLFYPDIVIMCMQILDDMVTCWDTSSVPVLIKERLHRNTLKVLMLCRTIRPDIRSPCISILYSLADYKFQKNYNSANTRVLFGFLHESLPQHEQQKLVLLFRSYFTMLGVSSKEEVSTRQNIKILLGMIRLNWNKNVFLKELLHILANLTDMAVVPCCNIVLDGGLDLLTSLLAEDTGHSKKVVTSAMIVLMNIAEVADLRKDILKDESLMSVLLRLLLSKDTAMVVMSAEIVANLSFRPASEWPCLWGIDDLRKVLVRSLHGLVLGWIKEDVGKLRFVVNTFRPFFILLQKYDTPPCQLYAAWLIRKFCTDNTKKYQDLLIKEDGISVLLDIDENEYADETLRKVVGDILSSITLLYQ